MAGYSREQAIDFWFAFDQNFLFKRPPEVNAAIAAAYPEGDLNDLIDLVKGSAGEEDLAKKLDSRKAGILALAGLQDAVMSTHFPAAEDLRHAFEDFGQGVLFDNRNPRPVSRRIHMMDGTPEDWIGYHRWFGFTRGAIALGADRARWSAICRSFALAWGIQSEAEPVQDAPANPGLPEPRLTTLRMAWLGATEAALHAAFLSYPGTFNPPNHVGHVRAPAPETLDQEHGDELLFADVRAILDAAVGPASPNHGGQGRFWNLPLASFKTTVVYGEPLIAAPGANQGARSALITVLRGTLAGFPRMPLNRPVLPDEKIDAIEAWIDAGCPEDAPVA